ncbi:unnamed protein product, partial [Rangifer tarandus platyrhynchus]
SPPSSTSLNLEDLVLFCHKGHGLGVEVRWQGGEIACSLSPMLGPVNLNLVDSVGCLKNILLHGGSESESQFGNCTLPP